MLRQSPSRNFQRTKGLKVKHAFQTFVALAITIWVVYQLKNFIHNKAINILASRNGHDITSSSDLSEKAKLGASSIDIKLLGRKALFPLEDEAAGNESARKEERKQAATDGEGEGGSTQNSETEIASGAEDGEEREVERIEDLIDENDRADDDEGVDEDEIEHWDKQIEEAESTDNTIDDAEDEKKDVSDIDHEQVLSKSDVEDSSAVNNNEIQATILSGYLRSVMADAKVTPVLQQEKQVIRDIEPQWW